MKCVAKTNFGKADMLAAHRDGKPCHKKRGYEVFHECEIEHDGKKIGSWSMRKTING